MPAFQNALAIAAKTQSKLAGHSIVYRISDSSTINISDAVLGFSKFEKQDVSGVKIRSESIDWLIFVSALVLSATPVEPTPGHRIEHTVSGVKRTYEVTPLGDEPCYRFAGPVRDRYRIHVKEIPNA